LLVSSVLALACGAATAACSDDHDHDHGSEHDEHALPPSCEAFHDDCVKVMQSNAKAAECDEFSHGEGRTEEECAAKKAECVAACTGPGAADAGASDASADGG